MSALATRIEREAGRPLTPIEIFNISASREATLSRLLTLYTGPSKVMWAKDDDIRRSLACQNRT